MNKLRVWHIPQVPMKAFYVEVKSPKEAIEVMDILADYDIFQFRNNIKPDYTNASGLQVFNEKNNEWEEWYDDEYDMDIDEYKQFLAESYESGDVD